MTTLTLERWSRACSAIGVQPTEREYRRVCRAWRSLGRHYHTLTHLDACLRELDAAIELAERPAEVELALWFHDAIYRTWRKDNEAQSANFGQPADAYADFERAIRREYWWVPRARYVAGRGHILKSFLERESIYRHARFREQYEQPARENLARALEQLGR